MTQNRRTAERVRVMGRDAGGDAIVRRGQSSGAPKRVLNVGSGPGTSDRLHRAFVGWTEVRLDIDPKVSPDIVGTIRDMKGLVPDRSFDAIWSSHNLEHLHSHEVLPSLAEFRRVLKEDGFALVTCPDLEAVATILLDKGLTTPAYTSPAGPIAALDMLFGHGRSIAGGNLFMCHNTGFTLETLGNVGLSAGFTEARVAKGVGFDLWALLLMPRADLISIAERFNGTSEQVLTMNSPDNATST